VRSRIVLAPVLALGCFGSRLVVRNRVIVLYPAVRAQSLSLSLRMGSRADTAAESLALACPATIASRSAPAGE
jgi:hypothetical protein